VVAAELIRAGVVRTPGEGVVRAGVAQRPEQGIEVGPPRRRI
jgi:hypothetical protein